MKFEGNWVINDKVRVLIGGRHFGGHLGYQTKPILKLEREFDKSNPYMKFGGNTVINDSPLNKSLMKAIHT